MPSVTPIEVPDSASNAGKWDASYRTLPNPCPYGDTLSYEKAAHFLAGLDTVEDWGCGPGWFKRYLAPGVRYKGVDGSHSPFADEVADLTRYTSQADGILLRHVLEHNDNWRAILSNALRSFTRRLVIVLFTPFVETTRRIGFTEEIEVPDIAFARHDLIAYFQGLHWTLEEGLQTGTQYGVEHIFYISSEVTPASANKLPSPERPATASNAGELYGRALQHYQARDPRQAESLCWEILQREPLHGEAVYLLGVLALDAGQSARALLHFHHATLLQPSQAPFHHALGEVYRGRAEPSEAAKCFREALRLDPNLVSAHHALGLALLDQGELDQAITSFRQTLALQPHHPRAHTNLGQTLHRKGDLSGAAACFREAIRLKADYAIPHNNLGAILQEQGQYAEAVASLRRALQLQPNYPEAHCNLGNVLRAQHDPAAVGCYQEAIRLRPDYVKAHCYLGIALAAQGRTDEAITSLQNALRLKPDYLEALENFGHVLLQQARWEAALPVFQQVLAQQPDHAEAFACLVRIRELLCDWRTRAADFERLRRDVEQRLAAGQRPALTPFNTMTTPWPATLHLAIARSYSESLLRSLGSLPESLHFTYPRSHKGRLRIGYVSGTFHHHALMHLMQSLFGLHDRQDFEIFAYSYGPDDGSSYRQRVQRDCDHFRDLAGLSAADSARCIHGDGIHLLIDLMGFTGGAREEMVALRPAPVQVSYIGFAGSMGAPFLDYLISDAIVTPSELAAAFSERLVLLPHCYLVTDHHQEIATTPTRRAEFGLPENGFVFTSFNNSYKFEPQLFGIWMKILQQVPGSVLWLYSSGATVEQNLRREAVARGIAAERILFAPHRPKAEHLARLRLADLFLDTYYVNAHTGACDALWAGLPVLTCPGQTFVARVAASLVANVGLPELIADNLEMYEQRAVHLAHHPQELRHLRERLAVNRTTWPLFDTPRFTRNLERAYRAMWEIYAAGQAPQPIVVTEPGC